MPSMEKRDTRMEIIRIGTDLISRQGFNATGIDQILKEAGVPKGSFYHYFKSKEDFGMAVLDVFAGKYSAMLDSYLLDEELPPLSRLRRYLERGIEAMEKTAFSKGCLAGNLGQEMADQHEGFRQRLEEIFASWQQKFGACIAEAQASGELHPGQSPEVIAEFLLSGWEGAILRAKVTKSPKPLHDFVEILFSHVLK